jgi:hypothetical protein
MNPIIIKLPPDTYLSAIEPFKSKGLDTNSIYHKTVTGVGISTFAIRFLKENLIQSFPNKPVVEAKAKEHNFEYPDSPVLANTRKS